MTHIYRLRIGNHSTMSLSFDDEQHGFTYAFLNQQPVLVQFAFREHSGVYAQAMVVSHEVQGP